VIRAFEALEWFIYHTADAITVNSPRSHTHVLARGGSAERAQVVSNWIDVDFIRPGPRDNDFRRTCGLTDRFVVLYAGTMGYQQDLDTIIEAAMHLREEPDICFQIVGDGVERQRLQRKAHDAELTNVVFTPFQPRADYPMVLQAADACVVTLKKEVRTPAIPSKLLGIMAAGKPTIVSANEAGDAPALVKEVLCGVCVSPGDPVAFAHAVRYLRDNEAQRRGMGRRAREYAERHFSRVSCATQYEALFARLTDRWTGST
jgi:glycosyltransferase involved in cell wall biosynthesis